MARGEGEVESRSQGIRSHFVERVVKLPMFNVAWDYAANTYSSIKESNRLVNFTLTNAERSVNFVAGQAKPMVMKFEKQIQVVDDLACKGLGTLEEKVPLITKHPEEIIGDTKKLYSSTVYSRLEDIQNYGRNKVKSVTDYGLQKVSSLLNIPLVSSLMKSVDGVLVVTENYIDYILPPVDNETTKNDVKKKEGDEKKNGPLTSLTRIVSTIRRRTYKTVILRIRNFQTRMDNLMSLPSVLLAIGVESIENANDYAKRLWIIITSDDVSDKEIPNSFPLKQLVPLARFFVKPLADVGSALWDRLHLSSAKKSEMNNISNNVEHSPAVISTVKDGVMWVIGLITTSTHVLPFYLYSWFSYFFPKPEERAPVKVNDGHAPRSENSVQDQSKEQNHVQEQDNSPNDFNVSD